MLVACGARTPLDDDADAGAIASIDAGRVCECDRLPPPVCIGPHRGERYTDLLGCDDRGCLWESEIFDCGAGACVGGECTSEEECGPGEVRCDPGLCDPGAPLRCVPDPEPCLEPVTAMGCDGRTYGTLCGALAAGVCENDCDRIPPRVLGPLPCPRADVPLTVLRDLDAWTSYFADCAIPYSPPDFAVDDAVVACYRCACAASVVIDGVRDCGEHAIVDFHYPTLCMPCDECYPSCALAFVPKLTDRVLDSFYVADCD